ncbi:D-aspartate oxidase [Elysia marginata]|uniref:D-aspartate oxidase n=1 Tax=Elysia marginata TaxID=1093978 RepID=A0AAV4IFN3_9GAST|nr:D-aspartate oxidase [Elysia marginata]
MDVPHYMTWLMKRFRSKGGIIRQKRVENIEEIASDCDILINCSATSSRFLFKDEQVYPTRGQVWKVNASGVHVPLHAGNWWTNRKQYRVPISPVSVTEVIDGARQDSELRYFPFSPPRSGTARYFTS